MWLIQSQSLFISDGTSFRHRFNIEQGNKQILQQYHPICGDQRLGEAPGQPYHQQLQQLCYWSSAKVTLYSS